MRTQVDEDATAWDAGIRSVFGGTGFTASHASGPAAPLRAERQDRAAEQVVRLQQEDADVVSARRVGLGTGTGTGDEPIEGMDRTAAVNAGTDVRPARSTRRDTHRNAAADAARLHSPHTGRPANG